MSARAWLNLGLLALMIGLTLIVWLRPGSQEPEETRLTRLDPDTVTRISLERSQQPTIEFRQRDGRWWVTAPVEIPANQVRVDALLNLAVKTSDTSYRAEALDLARFGLAEPKASVRLDDRTVALGETNPVSYRRYVLVGDRIYLISDDLYDIETVDAASYASPRLLPREAKIAVLTLPKLKLERGEGGAWRQRPPDTLTGAQIETLLTAWRDAQALLVNAQEKKPSRAAVTIELEGDQKLLFEITARKPQLILARPELGIQYHLPAHTAKSLLYPEHDASATAVGAESRREEAP